MRRLFLVGMAPPTNKTTRLAAELYDPTPHSSGSLGSSLVALDPRHGVFPNHVMTPLLATLYHLRTSPADAQEFLHEQIPLLLEDVSPRRFNVLQMPEGKNLALSPSCQEMLDGKLEVQRDLLLVFGYWSVSAIIYYTLTGDATFTEGKVNSKSEEFLRGVLSKLKDEAEFAKFGFPRTRAPRPGIYFRLFTSSDVNAPKVVEAIIEAIKEVREISCEPELLARMYRSLVPLPHDEAYKNKPVGKFQNCFMLGADPERHSDCGAPPQVFWRYAGSTVARRLLVGDDSLA